MKKYFLFSIWDFLILWTDIPSGRTFKRLDTIFDSSDFISKEKTTKKIKNNNFISI